MSQAKEERERKKDRKDSPSIFRLAGAGTHPPGSCLCRPFHTLDLACI